MKTSNLKVPVFIASFIFGLSLIYLNFVPFPVNYLIAILGLFTLASIMVSSMKSLWPRLSHIESKVQYPLKKANFALGFVLLLIPDLLLLSIWLGIALLFLKTSLASELFNLFHFNLYYLLFIIVPISKKTTDIFGIYMHRLLSAGYYSTFAADPFADHIYGKKFENVREFIDTRNEVFTKISPYFGFLTIILNNALFVVLDKFLAWIKSRTRK